MIKGYTVGKNEYTGELYLTIFPESGDPIGLREKDLIEVKDSIDTIFSFLETVKSPEEQEKDKLIEIINDKTTDEEKLAIIDIYEEWTIGKYFNLGDIRRHEDKLYKCIQAHNSQADWSPDVAVSLWSQIGITNPDTGLEELVPSTTNLYKAGDIGTWKGRVYKSKYDNNGNEPDSQWGADWWEDLGTIEEYLGGLNG